MAEKNKEKDWISQVFDQIKEVNEVRYSLERINRTLTHVTGSTDITEEIEFLIPLLANASKQISDAVGFHVNQDLKATEKSTGAMLGFLLNPRVQILDKDPTKAEGKDDY